MAGQEPQDGREDAPRYYRLYRDTWETINKSLTRAQAAKLLYAMAAYFFDGDEPGEGSLPKPVRAMFDVQRGALANYRRNALNGNRSRQKVSKKLAKSSQEPTQEVTQKPTQEIEGQQPPSPAETQKVGGEHSGKHSGKSASNIINHKSLITLDTPSTQQPFEVLLRALAEAERETSARMERDDLVGVGEEEKKE
jgi:hypothetical protein